MKQIATAVSMPAVAGEDRRKSLSNTSAAEAAAFDQKGEGGFWGLAARCVEQNQLHQTIKGSSVGLVRSVFSDRAVSVDGV